VVAGSIADELILLALFPDNDGWPVGHDGLPRVPSYLRAAVSVALLADLAVAGAVTVGGADDRAGDKAGDRVTPTGRDVSADPELSELAAGIARLPGQTPEYWAVQIYLGEPERRHLQLLRRQNLILDYERTVRRLWWSRTERRWFVREDDSVTELIARRLSGALRTGEADERTTTLLAIVHSCGLQRQYFKNLDRREREQRIRAIIGRHWAWRATRRCLSTVNPVMA
jgi:hypothetical protein